MTKKEYLLKLLESISIDILPIKNDLLYLIENNQITDWLIDTLYNMFHEIAKTAKTQAEKERLQKWLNILEKIKVLEDDDKTQEQKDIEALDDLLQNI
jgi:hypothetical protein